MRSKIEAKILEAAIELFAESGYAAGAREIAERAGSTTMTMYRAFRNRKENLFEEALREVINSSFDPGKFVLLISEDQGAEDFASVLYSGLERWYFAIQPASARLLEQARLSSSAKWRETANAALQRIMDMLATAIERQLPKKQKQSFNARVAAQVIVSALFHTKVIRSPRTRSAKPDKEEAAEVEALLNYCLGGVVAALKA